MTEFAYDQDWTHDAVPRVKACRLAIGAGLLFSGGDEQVGWSCSGKRKQDFADQGMVKIGLGVPDE